MHSRKREKTLLKSPAKNQSRIHLALSKKEKEKESASVSKPVNQSLITSFITKEETVKAETHWALEFLLSNYSFNFCSTKTELFAAMFSDSTITKQFSMGKTRCAYSLTYRMALHFKDIFLQSLKEVPL